MNESYDKSIIIGRINSIGPLTLENKKDCHIVFDIKHSTIVNGEEVIEYQSVIAYNKQAKIVAKYTHPDDLVCVEGKLNNNTKTIESEHITFLSSGKKDNLSIEKDFNIF